MSGKAIVFLFVYQMGETMLIDAGTASYGNHIVQYIKDSGNDTLDYVIITHPHADHIGGMSAVLKAFEIEQIYMPNVSTNTKTYQTLLQNHLRKNLTIQPAHAGMVLFEEKKSARGTSRADGYQSS